MVLNVVGAMSTSSYKRQAKVFCAAARIKSDARREAFLERACAKDAALRAHIKKLLAVQADCERFFADMERHPPQKVIFKQNL